MAAAMRLERGCLEVWKCGAQRSPSGIRANLAQGVCNTPCLLQHSGGWTLKQDSNAAVASSSSIVVSRRKLSKARLSSLGPSINAPPSRRLLSTFWRSSNSFALQSGAWHKYTAHTHRNLKLCCDASRKHLQVADGPLTLDKLPEVGGSDVIFVGTGTSEGIPRVSCLTSPDRRCPICFDATRPGSRNRRRNTSLMVRYQHPDGRKRNILIDAGKFFYHSALQWFPYHGVRRLDAVLVTHSHADAIGGLDDLRDWTNNIQDKVPIYVAPRDLEVMGKTHYYLVDPRGITKGTAVSKLDFKVMPEHSFPVEGLEVVPLPVWHGKGYKSLGFRIGNVCYLSDVSEIPDETYPLLQDCDLLILDALRPDSSSPTHFGLVEALDEVRKIKPRRTLFTGMMHNMEHEEINKQLAVLHASEGIHAELSYDGLRVPIFL